MGFGLLRHKKFLGDKVYERTDSDLDLIYWDIEHNGNIYKLCGHAFKSGIHTIYLVKDMFVKECEDSNNEICRKIVEWADGKYQRRWNYGW